MQAHVGGGPWLLPPACCGDQPVHVELAMGLHGSVVGRVVGLARGPTRTSVNHWECVYEAPSVKVVGVSKLPFDVSGVHAAPGVVTHRCMLPHT
jgi:hypothetical protein